MSTSADPSTSGAAEEEVEEIVCQPPSAVEPEPSCSGAEEEGSEQQEPSEPPAPPPASTSQAPDAVDEAEADSLKKSEQLKQSGNEQYASEQYEAAAELYWQALDICPDSATQKAIYYANLAACYLKMEQWQLAVEQCTNALRIDEAYVKALVRRATALEQLDDMERALADANKVLEVDPGNTWAVRAQQRLEPVVKERQEKLKEEMLGKLKDLGNTLLGKFGMSLDNFKAEKDPNTGSYSIKFQQ